MGQQKLSVRFFEVLDVIRSSLSLFANDNVVVAGVNLTQGFTVYVSYTLYVTVLYQKQIVQVLNGL